jgi:ubiquinone/menaquinone biosynthesis C-methylase UbiE
MSEQEYIHGYSVREQIRLGDQATTLTELLHHDTAFQPGSQVLELGCGVGAQTVILARNGPEANITSVDISPMSVAAARARVAREGIENVTFHVADLFDLPFSPGTFDHVFICFVLEHIRDPQKALCIARDMMRPGGTLTVIEGDHGSAYYHPQNELSQRTIDLLIEFQGQGGGDALIGRKLFPLLHRTGFRKVAVSPRMVYVDPSKPDLEEGFTKNTFTAMVEGIGERVLSEGRMSKEDWEEGINGLLRTIGQGSFCYTFFKGSAVK